MESEIRNKKLWNHNDTEFAIWFVVFCLLFDTGNKTDNVYNKVNNDINTYTLR